jgi:hypothetical protein
MDTAAVQHSRIIGAVDIQVAPSACFVPTSEFLEDPDDSISKQIPEFTFCEKRINLNVSGLQFFPNLLNIAVLFYLVDEHHLVNLFLKSEDLPA